MTGFLHHVFSRFHQFLLPYPQIGTICSHSTLDNMWITTKAGVHAQRIKYTNVCCKQCCMYCLKSGAVMIDLVKAKNNALSIVRDFGLLEPPVDPVMIARHLGVKVHFSEFAPEHSKVSGFYDTEEDAIYVNEDEFPLRQTFTVGHELGHRTMHREWAASNDYVVLMRDNARNKYELEADEFAGNLLAPRFMLDKYYERLSIAKMSQLFAISVPAIKVRLSKEYGI